MKENTKQILKVSICTLMALVLFAGVILMCIYFAFDNSNDGVADAYTDEDIGVSNIYFNTNTGFYIANVNNFNSIYISRLYDYYFYYQPGMKAVDDVYIEYEIPAGHLSITYYDSNNQVQSISKTITLILYKDSSEQIYSISSYVFGLDDLLLFDLTYNYVTKTIVSYQVVTGTLTNASNYFVDITTSSEIENSFANIIASTIGDFSSFQTIYFSFYNTTNLGCFISSSETFAVPPVVMPPHIYYENLQDKYDDGVASQQQTIQNLQQEVENWRFTANQYYQQTLTLQQQITTLQLEKSDLQQDNIDLQGQLEDLQNQINLNNALIEELRDEIRYYESLDLNMSLIDVFNPARTKSSTFVYDGVTYTSNSIVSTDDGWSVYSSTYYNQELPPNYGVGFSLFLPESISNTKFYVYGDITGWYNYTYCTEPDEQGNQTCYNVTDMIPDISVGYRNQNGNIVKVGTFTSNLPGAGGVDFFIDTPTNEIVFFVESCNLLEVGRVVQVSYYQYDTQSIYNEGYENGKSQGLKVGREEGYYQGVADANDYSFFSLFTSVFDAPITSIVGKWGDSDGDGVYEREGGMLNFYIPGLDINFAPFLLSLFTIAIIILVIRFVMARKS